MMKRVFYFISFVGTILLAQPKEAIEFQLNTISGLALNEENQTPISDLKIEILSGNNLVKDSTFTDEDGNFIMEKVGYVWKPKIRFSSRDFEKIILNLSPEYLDSLNNIFLRQMVTPIPTEMKISL